MQKCNKQKLKHEVLKDQEISSVAQEIERIPDILGNYCITVTLIRISLLRTLF